MKKILLLTVLMFTCLTYINAQYPAKVKFIECHPNKITKINGNLSDGFKMNDLSWASRSSTACFPATQNKKFRGNHVLFAMKLPKHSVLKIKLIPKNKHANFSLYAYQVGSSNYKVVPNLQSCVSCEADYKWDYPKRGKTQDHTRNIYLNATTNNYNVVIGVAGAENLTIGEFTLEIDLKSKVESKTDQQTVKLYTINAKKGNITTVKGKLEDGVKINDLSWAWSSANACFPETQKQKFTGNHVLYSTIIPKYSKMSIELIPDNKNDNFSLYSYTIGENSTSIVPNLPRCISCEADHKWDRPKKGKTQDHTRKISNIIAINRPYKIMIGVVGANSLNKGSYQLKITILDR